VRDPALVLFGFPVEFVGADGFEFVEFGPEDFEVEVMAEVDPCGDEEGKVGTDEGVVEVVEGFGGLDWLD
jgi:hypothetical protein